MRPNLMSLILVLLPATLPAQAPPDNRADVAKMFPASGGFGPNNPSLDALNPPLLGGPPLALSITADPAATTGITFFSYGAQSGFPLTVVDPLTIYLDPLLLFSEFTFPLTNGLGGLSIPMPPPAPPLLGLDVALQSAVISPTNVGASNMLALNLGSTLLPGVASYAWPFHHVLQTPNAYLVASNGAVINIHCNPTNNPCQVTIQGARHTTGGRLEIRNSPNTGVDGGASILAIVPTLQGQFSVTVTVAPGQCLYLFNRDDANGSGVQSGPIDVDYQILVQCP